MKTYPIDLHLSWLIPPILFIIIGLDIIWNGLQ
jgi:hypothetical protein